MHKTTIYTESIAATSWADFKDILNAVEVPDEARLESIEMDYDIEHVGGTI
jgi:hypothetical protein